MSASEDDFRPLLFLKNPHLQTIVGSLLPASAKGIYFQPRQIVLPDEDRLLLYDSIPPQWRSGHPIILMVHGLSGCHRSGNLLRLTRLLLPDGYRIVRMDLRAAGPSVRFARKTYNAACSPDIRAVVADLHRDHPQSPIVLAGFSLGGNIVLKVAGEVPNYPVPGFAAVVAMNPPIDLEACTSLLNKRGNRIYNHYFARALVRQIRRHWKYFPDLPRVHFPRSLTLQQFDDLHTAPRGGFANSTDYYRKGSSLPLLGNTEVPTFVLTSRDDPFVAFEPIEALKNHPFIQVYIVSHGGHLGFLGGDGKGGFRWAEPRIADWIRRTIPITA
ncbi:MAG: YheT family hydrolase [Bdellovibrionales bacterium]